MVSRQFIHLVTALAVFIILPTLTTGIPTMQSQNQTATVIFAAGCYWCIQHDFEKLNPEGLIKVTSGFAGGTEVNPSYEDVSGGYTHHTEAIEIVYDPRQLPFVKLLAIFWRNVDMFDADGQFCDRGRQYRPEIFYTTEEQKMAAQDSKERLEKGFEQKISVPITAAGQFYPAKEGHQHYATKNPFRYNWYRSGCGRDKRLEQIRELAKRQGFEL